MASVICHGCGKAFDPPAGYTRAKIQCPGCGVICNIPAGARSAPAPAAKKAAKSAPVEDDWFNDEPKIAPKEEEPVEAEIDSPVPSMELDGEEPDDVDVVDEDDDRPYELREKLGPRCPKCKAELPPDGVVCVKCGFNRKTRKKAERTYQPIGRMWESDRTLANRLMLMGAAQGYHFFLGLMCYWFFGTFMPAIIAWFPLTGMLCFLLGTYDQITLTRDTRGRVRLIKQWRFAFVPMKPETVDVRGYEGVVSGPWMEVGVMEWVVLFSLLSWGVVPGVIWYWKAIHTPHYMVALAQDHGHAEYYVYRGRNGEQMNEIADAICAAASLPRLG
jgi:hypothetical protein